MDEPSMSRALAAAEFADASRLEEPAATGARLADLPWRSYARCFLLTAVVGAAGFIAFRPALLRFSILMSLVSPSRGESLVIPWESEPEKEPARLAPTKFTPPPDEWRPAAAHTAGWTADRPETPADAWQGGALGAGGWKRESFNPWAWSDDAPHDARRGGAADSMPGQKAETSFRTAAAGWGGAAPDAAPEVVSEVISETPPETAAAPAPKETPLLPLELPPALPAAQPEGGGNADQLSLAALPSLPSQMPALSLPPLPPAQPPERIVSEPVPLPDTPAPTPETPVAAPRTISPAEMFSATFAAATPAETSVETPAAPVQTPAPDAPVDWKEREITAPIPGAYLTIYPKLNFIGLCVPGQGYIRKYNQVAVPTDLTQPKQHAADGRTPYGKYYVADHLRDAAGPRVVLSWPSVEDARRGGAGPEMLAEIDRAWSSQAMPPQDSLAGGGLSLTGDRAGTEYTSGGFSLEAPHLEEIFTALPNGAWVFVQQ